jgi:hypothetical protein
MFSVDILMVLLDIDTGSLSGTPHTLNTFAWKKSFGANTSLVFSLREWDILE